MNKPHVVRSIIVVCFLVLYEIAARLEWLDSFTFIPFSTMIVSMVKHLSDPAYLVNHFGITTIEIIMSFLGAVIFGIIFGIKSKKAKSKSSKQGTKGGTKTGK